MARSSLDNRMKQFERICRERRLPLTIQRCAVSRAILNRGDHPTADQIHAQIKRRLPGMSRTSVYRILEVLVETGMIIKVCHPGSAVRYDPKLNRHHHLVCLSCERIIDIEEPRLDNLPLPNVHAYGFRINDYHIHFRGLCARCAPKSMPKLVHRQPLAANQPAADQQHETRNLRDTSRPKRYRIHPDQNDQPKEIPHVQRIQVPVPSWRQRRSIQP